MLAITAEQAMDIVDAYGADEALWPTAHRNTLQDLLRTNQEFSDYVEEIRKLDEMLENWDEQGDHDGVDVGDDDWDDLEDNEDDVDSEPADGEPDGPMGRVGQTEKVIEVDPDRLQDMGEMFSNAIQKIFQDMDQQEFRVFTRDFDRMVDIAGVSDSISLADIDQKVAKSTGVLQKDLRRLIAAQSQVKRIPGKRSGRLHAPNLHRIVAGDDRVFTRREEAQSLDTAMSLVIDCSGSMRGAELRLATEAGYALGSVLNRLGIQFECLGFTSDCDNPNTSGHKYLEEVRAADAIAPIARHTPIIMPKFKTFEERWTSAVQRRFAHVHANSSGYGVGFDMNMTPEGCGMEFAARRLLSRKEARKIMIVMTDGEPGGHCFNGSLGSRIIYGKQSRDMVKAIEAAGVDLVGVGIKNAAPTGYYTNAVVINNVSELPAELLKILKRFVLGK